MDDLPKELVEKISFHSFFLNNKKVLCELQCRTQHLKNNIEHTSHYPVANVPIKCPKCKWHFIREGYNCSCGYYANIIFRNNLGDQW